VGIEIANGGYRVRFRDEIGRGLNSETRIINIPHSIRFSKLIISVIALYVCEEAQ
jgi:hypothetical protein